jgi:ATP-dependent protease ClpP protease subunit
MLGALGLGDIHKLNAVKNLLAMLVNGMAAAMLAALALAGYSEVSWPHAALMAAIGFGLAGYYLVRG